MTRWHGHTTLMVPPLLQPRQAALGQAALAAMVCRRHRLGVSAQVPGLRRHVRHSCTSLVR